MTPVAVASLVAAGFFAQGDWVARLRHRARLEYTCKPATLVALVATAVALTPAHDAGARRDWFVAGLVCSLAGHVLLMLPSERFVAGLAAFLVGHLCYVTGFWTHGPSAIVFVIALTAVGVVVAPVGYRILSALQVHRRLRGPVALYMMVISVMLATALAAGNAWAGAGAALFATSDGMIAWNRFVRPFGAADVGIMVTYHLGQAGLVLSLLR
jgi:uncharacterized membrane protein YhhN